MEAKILSEPIKANEIEWRVSNAKDGKMLVVPYITNRCVMERFDNAFGIFGWQNNFAEWRTKGVKCGIGVMNNDQWIWKYDGADESDIEATKGGFSDSMKRVAVQWGIGRDLYQYPKVYIQADGKYIPKWAFARLDSMVNHIIAKGVETLGEVVNIKEQ